MTYDSSVLPADSNRTTIGTSGAGTISEVVTATAQSIAAASSSADIKIKVESATSPGILLRAEQAGTGMNGRVITGSVVSNVGFMNVTPFANGSTAITESVGPWPEVRSPGSAFTRPVWSAARQRRVVDGANKGTITNARYPFYDSYEKYAEDIRRVGKD